MIQSAIIKMALDSLIGRFVKEVPQAAGQDQHLMLVAEVKCSFQFKEIRNLFNKSHEVSRTI